MAHKRYHHAPRHPAKNALKDLAFVLVAFFVVNSFVFASFEVPTGSMENEIHPGEFVFVNKLVYGGTTPRVIPFTNIRVPWLRAPALRKVERGDAIVFEFPGLREEIQSPEFKFYLKRAIGLPGDTVRVANRVVYVNGKPAFIPRNMKLNSPRILPPGFAEPGIFPRGTNFNEDNWGPMVVPRRGAVLPLTPDNLVRWTTFIEREGHAVVVHADGQALIDGVPQSSYTVEHNYLFAMGDNRDNSLDGRFWGFIKREHGGFADDRLLVLGPRYSSLRCLCKNLLHPTFSDRFIRQVMQSYKTQIAPAWSRRIVIGAE